MVERGSSRSLIEAAQPLAGTARSWDCEHATHPRAMTATTTTRARRNGICPSWPPNRDWDGALSPSTQTSYTMPALPTGEVLWVRLYTYMSGNWVYYGDVPITAAAP